MDGDGGGFDGDAALAFEVHVIEHLLAELAFGDGADQLEHTVGKGALAVVDVGDDGEIADFHRSAGACGLSSDSGRAGVGLDRASVGQSGVENVSLYRPGGR